MHNFRSEPGDSGNVGNLGSLIDRKVLLVTGKGGIGKTLVSAALAQAAASLGKRVLVLEFGALDQVSPLFGVPRVGHERLEVGPGLFCANIDPESNFKDFVVKYLGQQKLFDRVISHRVIQSFIKTIPGLSELMMLGRLFYEGTVAPGARFDLIIFDAPASGHFLNMMTTPEAVLKSNIVGPLRTETERVKAFLQQKDKVGCLYVTVPEELVISEALDFLPQLARLSPAALLGVIVNKVPLPWCGQSLKARHETSPLETTSLEKLSEGVPPTGSESYQEFCKAQLAYEARSLRALQILEEQKAEWFQKTSASEEANGAAKGVELADLRFWDLPDLFAVNEPLEPDFWKKLLAVRGGPLFGKD